MMKLINKLVLTLVYGFTVAISWVFGAVIVACEAICAFIEGITVLSFMELNDVTKPSQTFKRIWTKD